jgi:hypothetical protein
MAGDRVRSRNGGVDRACCDNVRCFEQFRRFEELARVDEPLSRLLHVARFAGSLAPTHR